VSASDKNSPNAQSPAAPAANAQPKVSDKEIRDVRPAPQGYDMMEMRLPAEPKPRPKPQTQQKSDDDEYGGQR